MIAFANIKNCMIQELSQLEFRPKRKHRTIPRFKCVSDEKPSDLQTLVSFYDESFSLIIQSFEENNVDASEIETGD